MNLLSKPKFLSNLKLAKLFKKPDGWLVLIGSVLAIIHLTMIGRVGALSYGGLSFLFWCAVASLVWEKRKTLTLKSGVFATCFAIALLLPLLIKSIFLMTLSTSALYIFPIIAGISLGLLASGFQGLSQYRRELLLLLILGATQPLANIVNNFDPSFLTARFATYTLWYSGFNLVREGTNIYFAGSPNGVEVYPGCSGVDAIMHLLSLTILFFFLFPSNLKVKLLLPLAAILIGFVVNGLRVALLAIIVAYHDGNGFEYWHAGEGSLLFSMVAAGLLCGVDLLLMQDFIGSKQTTEQEYGDIWP